MKSNIALIGMPGSGKSTVGVHAAKTMAMNFIDTDTLITKAEGKSLQTILNESTYQSLIDIEEKIVAELDVSKYVIATGGSVIYGPRAMEKLKKIAHVLYLDVPIHVLKNRVDNWNTRGIANPQNLLFSDLFRERTLLYKKYCDFSIHCENLSISEIVSVIKTTIEKK